MMVLLSSVLHTVDSDLGPIIEPLSTNFFCVLINISCERMIELDALSKQNGSDILELVGVILDVKDSSNGSWECVILRKSRTLCHIRIS